MPLTNPTTSFSTVRLDQVLLRCQADVQAMDPAYVVQLNGLGTAMAAHCQLLGNATLLHSLFLSLVENACRYSTDHRANVRLAFDSSEILVQVEDNGIGIVPEDYDRVFEPDLAGRKGRFADEHGIGLAVARRIAELHNGYLVVGSSSGHGTCFTAHLPKQP